jgi:hypothetical protein
VQHAVSPVQVVVPHPAPPTTSPESLAGAPPELLPPELLPPEPLPPPDVIVEASVSVMGAPLSPCVGSASTAASVGPPSDRTPPPVGRANVHVPGMALVPLKAMLVTGAASVKHDCTSKQFSPAALPLVPKTRLS